MHSRRARPTLRLLEEDLTSGWGSPFPRRSLLSRNLAALHPPSELPHPIIAKAVECFGTDSGADHFVGLIASSTQLRLMEIKTGQWRGGVWHDPTTGVHWLMTAGLAKGEHQDHDDFYQRVDRVNSQRDTSRWMPTPADEHLLRQETAARLIGAWELLAQAAVLDALRAVSTGGKTVFDLPHPLRNERRLATLTLEVSPVREEGYLSDDIALTIEPDSEYAAGDLLWQLTIRALITLSPPEQGWDRDRNTFLNMGEPGCWDERLSIAEKAVAEGLLLSSEPGRLSHYTHRKQLAGSTIEGRAVRSLCGSFFVPTQDHDTLPVCPECETRYQRLNP